MTATEREFMVARDLGPGDASAAREALLAWLAAQPEAGCVELAPGDARPSPLAIQLLVSASRSRTHPDLRLGPSADATLSTLGTMQMLEDGAP